ncbi:MAG TPA: cell division protein ZapA [Pseudogracilibacillus sp.]|nr:cell division protein ZapA [Pseudogracilibacillus sp.]
MRRSVSVTDKSERKKIDVKINRKKYTIVGTESKEHMELVAKLVNDKMEEIYQANKHLDTTKLAVLTAINTMNDYLKLKADYKDLETLIEEEY